MLFLDIQLFGGRGASGISRLDVVKKSYTKSGDSKGARGAGGLKNYTVIFAVTEYVGGKSSTHTESRLVQARNKTGARIEAKSIAKSNTISGKRYHIKSIYEE